MSDPGPPVEGSPALPQPAKLHPAVMALWPLKQSVGIVLFALFGGFNAFGPIIIIAGLAMAVIASYVRWSRFTWWIEAGTLVVEQGLLQRKRRVIPADRVQSVDLIKPLPHRVFGVVQVRVEAIGGDQTEGLLEALEPGTAFQIQRALLGDRAPRHAGQSGAPPESPAPPPPGSVSGPAGGEEYGSRMPAGLPQRPPTASDAANGDPRSALAPGTLAASAQASQEPRTLATVSPRKLVLAGLTGARVGVAAVIFGGASQLFGDSFFGPLSFGGSPFGDGIQDTVESVAGRTGLVTGALLLTAAAALIFALSVAATAVTYWGFAIMRDGTELRISRGLLEQRLETVPLRRIQSLRIEQNFLRRRLGLASVQADLAGRAGDASVGSGVLLPIGTLREATALVSELMGTDGPVTAVLQPAPARARRRFAIRAFGPAVLGAGITAAVASPLGIPLWVIPVVGVAAGLLALPLYLAGWRALGRAEVEGTLVSQTGVIVQRRIHVPVARIQTMTLSASPFQRRLNLTDVQIGIATSAGGVGPTLAEVDADLARQLVATATHEAVEASRILT